MIRFRSYSTDKTVPVAGFMKVRMRNQVGGLIQKKVYVLEGERESFLGKEDAIARGILQIEPEGRPSAHQRT